MKGGRMAPFRVLIEDMPTPTPQKESWWPTIGAIVLLIIILVLGLFSYQSYAHNVELAQQNSDMSTQIITLSANNDSLTARVGEITKELSRLQCDGAWNGESCDSFPVTITAQPASGTSPLIVNFVVRAKHSKYTLDFGDGMNGWLARTNTNSDAGCTPKEDGFCYFNLSHTYRSSTSSVDTFEMKVKNDTAVVATSSITVSPKK